MSFERGVRGKMRRIQWPDLRILEGSREGLGSSNSSLRLPQILSLIFNLVNHTLLVAQSCCTADFLLFFISLFFCSYFRHFPSSAPSFPFAIFIYSFFFAFLFFFLSSSFSHFSLGFSLNDLFRVGKPPTWESPLARQLSVAPRGD